MTMRTSIQYTLLRLLIFFVCLLLLALIPALRENLLLLVVIATTVSMLVSVFALNRMRDQMSRDLVAWTEERRFRRQQRQADERMEDLEDGSDPAAQDSYR